MADAAAAKKAKAKKKEKQGDDASRLRLEKINKTLKTLFDPTNERGLSDCIVPQKRIPATNADRNISKEARRRLYDLMYAEWRTSEWIKNLDSDDDAKRELSFSELESGCVLL